MYGRPVEAYAGIENKVARFFGVWDSEFIFGVGVPPHPIET
jgi:hypothetical protein